MKPSDYETDGRVIRDSDDIGVDHSADGADSAIDAPY
jgi:hypothetical protein